MEQSVLENPIPLNLTCFDFRTMAEHQTFFGKYQGLYDNIWLWHETLGNQTRVDWAGICDNCLQCANFLVAPEREQSERFSYRARWTDLTCQKCGLDARDRAVLRYLREMVEREESLYHVGYHSKLSHLLGKSYVHVKRTQFQEGMNSGQVDQKGIQYEDLTQLSFAQESFDCIICLEVLEHIHNYVSALKQMFRVLKPNGRAVMTFPWLGGSYYEHLVRAEILPDGSINHILPPEYHGDPAREEGILSFRAFGWQILDELREVGFRDAFARFLYGPLHGHMTVLLPTIVAVK